MPKLLFTMTPGVNLSKWKEIGSIEREIKPYLHYAETGWEVTILTFGKEKYDFSKLHKNISVINTEWSTLRSFLLPFYLRKNFRPIDIIKTNQSYFSWVFVAAALLTAKPIVLRCGYVYGEYLQTVNGATIRTKLYKILEGWAFRHATTCIVTTEALRTWVLENYKPAPEKLMVIPNFVDTSIFKPLGKEKKKHSVISVGRWHAVKRFDLRIRACAEIPNCTLTIIGEGPEKATLQNLAAQLNLPLTLSGNIPNNMLPEALCTHEVFAITSLREGHPKALIEAMACAAPCVCSFYGQDDYISCTLTPNSTATEIAAAINLLLTEPKIACDIANKGFNFVFKKFSFTELFNSEQHIITNLIK